jgi:hypothetical protein
VGIDEPRHNPLSGGVDDLHIVSVVQPRIAWQAPRAFDAITLDHNGFIPGGRIPRAIDQSPVGDHDGFFSTHVSLLIGF